MINQDVTTLPTPPFWLGRATLAATAFVAAVVPAAAQDWSSRLLSLQPVNRAGVAGMAMAYDSVRKEVIGFDTPTGPMVRSETWAWNGSSWSVRNPVTVPPARDGAAMAFNANPARPRVVMFGGFGSGNVLDDTWEWDGTNWRQALTGLRPPRTLTAGMAYEGNNSVIIFGGGGNAGATGRDTWRFNGTSWVNVTPAVSPSARLTTNMAFDASRGRVVMFGGTANSQFFGDTWEWDGSTWTQIVTSPSPSARWHSGLSYDSKRNRCVLFGGSAQQNGGPSFNDTWAYTASGWTQLFPLTRTPPLTSEHGQAYDAERDQVVVRPASFNPVITSTWLFRGFGTTATNTPYGTACGGVSLTGLTRPIYGTNWDLEIGNVPAPALLGAVLLGLTDPNLPVGPLAVGCTQYSDSMNVLLLLSPTTNATVSLVLPNSPQFVALPLTAQGAILGSPANPLGLAATNGLRGVIGDI